MGPFEMVSWYAVWGPRNLDAKASEFLVSNVSAVVNSDEFKAEARRVRVYSEVP